MTRAHSEFQWSILAVLSTARAFRINTQLFKYLNLLARQNAAVEETPNHGVAPEPSQVTKFMISASKVVIFFLNQLVFFGKQIKVIDKRNTFTQLQSISWFLHINIQLSIIHFGERHHQTDK